jgi:hypothetical protein
MTGRGRWRGLPIFQPDINHWQTADKVLFAGRYFRIDCRVGIEEREIQAWQKSLE